MQVLYLTLFLSSLLAVVFIYLFATQHGGNRGHKSFEQQALLPLQEDPPSLAPDDTNKAPK